MYSQIRMNSSMPIFTIIAVSFVLPMARVLAQEPDLGDALQEIRARISDGAQSAPEIVAPPNTQNRTQRNVLERAQDLASLYHSVSEPVFELVVEGLKSGITLDGLQQLTNPYLTWSDWPDKIGFDSGHRPMGFDDNAAKRIADNSLREQVVLIYREHKVSPDLKLTYLQTSFCFPKVQGEFFWRSLDMAVVVQSPGEVHIIKLQYPLGNEWVVGGLFPLLFGFVQIPETTMPLILVGQKPSGTQQNCSVYVYIWSEEGDAWKYCKLRDFEDVTDLYFDADSSELRKYSGYAVNEATGHVDVPILDTSIHVPTFLREHKEYFAEQTGIDLFK